MTQSSVHQQEELCDSQIKNSAGGFVWKVKDIDRLRRFLCLGSANGTFYVRDEEKFGEESVKAVTDLITSGKGEVVVEEVVKYSVEGRVAKPNPLLLVLALCARCSDTNTKNAAYNALSQVCRIPTHLFQFIDYCERLSGESSGWGRAHRRAIKAWYLDKDPQKLAYLVTKYKKRGGWSHKDVLRLCHINPSAQEGIDAVFKYIFKGFEETSRLYAENENETIKDVMNFLNAVETVKNSTDTVTVAAFIEEHKLVREHIPTKLLKSTEVWGALLKEMPMTAMIRNLGKMTSIGMFTPNSQEVTIVVEKLRSLEKLKLARIHPFTVLLALKTYKSGKGEKGKLIWTPNSRILDELESAFYLSFKAVEPTRKRYMLAVDISGSMSFSGINGSQNMTAREAAAAMIMVTMKTEYNYQVMAFANEFRNITHIMRGRSRLEEVIAAMTDMQMGSTDCSIPMVHAMENNIPVDVFIVYTDCETYMGSLHPCQALENYRKLISQKQNDPSLKKAKLIVVAMTSNGFTIANPEDPGMLDIVGFDSNAPVIMSEFALGSLSGDD
ncbi:60 kDa SS-A/Ro ribonucleoprotein-like [Anneissia japonica]|uniref:60 kDa SS-A/Ro ribonucleoprotein-like n=1 Tax=Anneissia japonica TaxID=1529436 RepID=UPI0014259995|nr:60 kDa SS-A/Ro ribonucleoprotein-like [Anneissia japonica]XP_033096026.1 60 kDa SS-A/Ro ribonucleoprotein-like [Anneissia japonica]